MAKPITEWTVADLEALMGMEESSNLEFKDGRALLNEPDKKREIAKDVSAMANADGGTIIYGIHESQGVADRIAGCAAGRAEWFDQIISSQIEPKVQGVIIHTINLDDGLIALVIFVPKATTFAPHQSKAHHTYFRRSNTTINAMLDHEVRDLMRRATTPELFLKLTFHPEGGVLIPNARQNILMSVKLGNHASEPALYSRIDIFIEHNFLPQPAAHWERTEVPDTAPAMVLYRRSFMVPHNMPVFREVPQKVMDLMITISPGAVHLMVYEVSAPGFQDRKAFLIRLERDGSVTATPTIP